MHLGPPPASNFQPWDGKSTVIYDTKTGIETNLGPGSQPAYFSPDSSKAVWVKGTDFANGTDAFVIDLPTGAIRRLGPARMAGFIDSTHVFVFEPGGNGTESIDLTTGARTPNAPNPWGHPPRLFTPDGYEIVRADSEGPGSVSPFRVLEPATGPEVLSVNALAAVPAGRGEIAVATPIASGRSNIYLVDIRTGASAFVASAASQGPNWPFAANVDYVMWTDDFCGNPQGR